MIEKADVDHVSARDVEALGKRPTIEPLPQSAKTEAGVILNIENSSETSLRLAKDAMEWHESIARVNETNSINILMMALGGLLWVPMTSIIGRAPTLFWSSLFGFGFTFGTALAPNFTTFYAMRALKGFFITSAQTISIAFIRDMFFFHERARKIGLWAVLYIASPFWGPLVGNFVLGGTHRWEDVFWTCVGVCALDMVLIVAFLDETWYNRDIPSADQPRRGSGFMARMSRVVGIWELKHHKTYYRTFVQSYKRFIVTLMKPVIFVVLVAYLVFFMWAIGINITTAILFGTPREFGGYGYSFNGVGYLYFSPIVGVLLGEIFGHYFNDWLAQRYVRRHGGVFEPEARLSMIYVSAVPMIVGLVVLGQALQYHLHVSAVVMGWGLHTFGIMGTSVAVSAYVLDSYPTAPAEVSGWTNFARAIGGFGVGYFQQPWGAKVGFDVSFGTQAATVAVGIAFIALVHKFGHRWRVSAGPVE
ncbi:major facilitator superfamily domain-containing protein [Plectosphaerella cucumerina]|uniref:Major facilitator superfamily domain-containing protein n=1 Tax=Plectosphaerella cucumerina TaxID=40658 RepID=A0A8K0X4T3_9PEZI|nr:major facilitator superfamily domain-containing protein [Plectosphaerella cucumerina]